MNHIMLDLETLGTRPGSVILSVGAVQFDPKTGATGAEFYRNIDRVRSKRAGLTVDPETELWWAKQSREAQHVLEANCVSFGEAHADFLKFWAECGADRVWAHGASFDPPMYESACRVMKLSAPWTYKMIRDTRTIYDLAGLDQSAVPSEGVHHYAVDDCRFQIKCVALAWALIDGGEIV